MATPTITWYYYDGDSWEDMTAYVLTTGVSARYGMATNKTLDRLARPGAMQMKLKSLSGEFDPDDADCLTGWAINTKVKLVITYGGYSAVKWYGYVSKIQMIDNSQHEHIAQVTVSDWMRFASDFTITQQSIETYKRGDQVVDTTVDAVGHTPQATEYAVGDYEFEASFDSMTVKTKAATELNKIVLSEGGYFYNRHDRTTGEKLVFENATYRNGLRTLSKLPELSTSYLLKAGSATDHVLLAGTTDKVLLNTVTDAHMNGIGERYERSHGENILNKVKVTAYPKRVDTEIQRLYNLGDVIKLGSGETKTINVRYQNFTTKESCNAITSLMEQPVATTDYLMNTKRDGTGTDITSDLTVSVVYRTAEAEVTLTNNSGYKGKVTRLRLNGYGIYQDSSVKVVVEDSVSQGVYSEAELNIEQQYQRDTEMGNLWAGKIIASEKNPRTVLNKVTFAANKSEARMLAFLALDIGDLVKITESGLNIDYYYYINGVEFSITAGNIITYSWVLSEQEPSLANGGLSLIAVEFADYETENPDVPTEVTSSNRLTFGNVPELIDLPQMTITAWVYMNVDPATGELHGQDILTGWVDDAGGFQLTLADGGDFYYGAGFTKVYSIGGGYWNHNVGLATGYWELVSVSIDNSSVALVMGNSVGVTAEITPPSGNVGSWDGMDLCIGNIISTDEGTNLKRPLLGKITDVRVYNRALSVAEIGAIYTAGVGGANTSEGLIFNAPYVRTSDLAHYTDLAMTESDTVIDAIGGYVGTPKDSPTARLLT